MNNLQYSIEKYVLYYKLYCKFTNKSLVRFSKGCAQRERKG
jgi:hypothetical protein